MMLLDISKKKLATNHLNGFLSSSTKKKLEKSFLRPDPLTFIVIGFTWCVITFVNSAKTILPLLELLGLIKFRLQLFFFRIISTSTSNNIKRS